MIYLHKFLPLIVSPLFLILILILIGTFLKSKKIILASLFILIFFSLPIISNKLILYLEKDYSLQNISNIDEADAIVVLSGMVRKIENKNNLSYEFNDAVDRVLAGIDLFKENKAPLLIFTKGQYPWSKGVSEGEYLKKFSIKLGIREKNILLTDIVNNTEQEAISVKKLLNKNDINVILVTSAYHMPRAKKVFESVDLKVVPFAVDFRSSTKKITFIDFIPSVGSLNGTSKFIREIIGRLYYNMKYLI
jgi:uncharacterized SAM-binding protein YcdF (DUF218 family)